MLLSVANRVYSFHYFFPFNWLNQYQKPREKETLDIVHRARFWCWQSCWKTTNHAYNVTVLLLNYSENIELLISWGWLCLSALGSTRISELERLHEYDRKLWLSYAKVKNSAFETLSNIAKINTEKVERKWILNCAYRKKYSAFK